MIGELTPPFINALLDSFEPGAGVDVFFHSAGGAVGAVDETATAWPHRRAATMVVPVAFWPDAAQDDERIQAVRSIWAALEPHAGGYYENIQSEHNEVRSNFGPVFERLSALKQDYDPMNLFRLNNNIPPAA
jgi:hypothetical protein